MGKVKIISMCKERKVRFKEQSSNRNMITILLIPLQFLYILSTHTQPFE